MTATPRRAQSLAGPPLTISADFVADLSNHRLTDTDRLPEIADRCPGPPDTRRCWHSTGGNETVPIVQIGLVMLVNPTARDVLRTVAAELPDQVPEGYVPPQPGRASRLLTRLFGG